MPKRALALVLLSDAGLSLDDVRAELVRREGTSGVAEKAGRPLSFSPSAPTPTGGSDR